MIRLIALDLDGTLLGPDRSLSQENAQALRRAEESGLIVCLASGRSVTTIAPFGRQAGIRGPIVSCNGAYTLDRDGQEITHHGLDADTASLVLAYAEERGIHVNVYSRDKIAMSSDGVFARAYASRIGAHLVDEALAPFGGLPATKILFMDHPDKVDQYEAELRAALTLDQAVVVRSEPDYVEFLPAGITKGVGLADVAAHLGVGQHEVAALGDYHNDLEMVAWAGLGGAMGNAAEEVKKAARVVVGSNLQHGAAEFIRLVMEGA